LVEIRKVRTNNLKKAFFKVENKNEMKIGGNLKTILEKLKTPKMKKELN
jgi:hypothetical protein